MKNIAFAVGIACLLIACKKDQKNENNSEKNVEPSNTVAVVDTLTVEKSSNLTSDEPSTPTTSDEVKLKENAKAIAVSYAKFGEKFATQNVLTKEQMLKKYQSLKKGDTINVTFKSVINSVCKKKGCWMKMDLAKGKESFIRFKDYGFFVPLNADASTAIVSGKAFIDVVSIDELKHYEKDAGKSQAEIDKITEPKITYAFTANGVLIEE